METKFYSKLSFPTNFDMQKVKIAFSAFKDVKENLQEAVGFDVIEIKNLYNDTIFIEECNAEVKLNVKSFIISPGFIFTTFTIGSKLPEFKFDKNPFLTKKRVFKNSEFKSFNDIPKMLQSHVANLQEIMKNMVKLDQTLTLKDRTEYFVNSVKTNSCLEVIGKANLYFHQSWTFNFFKIEKEEHIPVEDYKLISDINNPEKLKVFEDKYHTYYKGNSELLDSLLCDKFFVMEKLKDSVSMCKHTINTINQTATKILERLDTKNPIFWETLSQEVELLQLCYIDCQNWITTILSNINRENFNEYYTKDYYIELEKKHDKYLALINSLKSQVESALLNIATPIKSRNDFKLQESTDRVNDRILFLSFIAMSIPLISYIVSDTLSQTTKLISGLVVGSLPLSYILLNTLYKNRLKKSYKKNNINEALIHLQKMTKSITTQIKVIEDNQKELGENIGDEFAKTMKLTLAGIEKNKKDLEAKLKKY